ncbi:MAG: exonuclease subunit SbcD [Magnetococcales bacterium]|nr:exonuclease SbcCD subunit D C-terminal domain-containing protein [Magnetococcales bacterium]NGZ04802.1 exonuclease subunit SbcD [Magnetococcales bacterium]
MKICHTSDWHLGHRIHGQTRHEEHFQFLKWLITTLRQETVDVLLIAGDLFDTTTPNTRAQELYYRFLASASQHGCRHIVIIGGNHDSPAFLDAPKRLLAALQVHVIGAIGTDPEEEVLVLHAPDGQPELIVCATPFLRDRDIRLSEAAESMEEKSRKWIEGICGHYTRVLEIAMHKRRTLSTTLPLVVMGHLFASGGRVCDGDGVRELYVGTLAQIPAGIFPVDEVDYLALGHLHQAQQVGGQPNRRYSGTPLPMGFDEIGRQKSVSMITFQGRQPSIELREIPCFQELHRIQGDRTQILAEVTQRIAANSQAWLEIIHQGPGLIGDLRTRLLDLAASSNLKILRIRDHQSALTSFETDQELHLEELDEWMVFERCLEGHKIPEQERPGLRLAHREIVAALSGQEPD